MELGWILFAKGDRHLTAEMLFEEASKARRTRVAGDRIQHAQSVHRRRSAAAGRVDGSKTYFDTNVSEHHHFFLEDANALVDIPSAKVMVSDLPEALQGYEIERVEVVVRLKRTGA